MCGAVKLCGAYPPSSRRFDNPRNQSRRGDLEMLLHILAVLCVGSYWWAGYLTFVIIIGSAEDSSSEGPNFWKSWLARATLPLSERLAMYAIVGVFIILWVPIMAFTVVQKAYFVHHRWVVRKLSQSINQPINQPQTTSHTPRWVQSNWGEDC